MVVQVEFVSFDTNLEAYDVHTYHKSFCKNLLSILALHAT